MHMPVNAYNPERKQYSIVLIGEFNPGMFHPEWFCRNDILSREDVAFACADTNKYPLINTQQITMFKTTQLTVKIETNRFQVVAEKEPLVSLKDFVVKCFDKLGSYVIKAYGFNYSAHYKIDSESKYQEIGDKLAPKEYWADLLGNDISGDDRKGGLCEIQMSEQKADEKGSISMLLQPSAQVKPGVFISCNDHNEVADDDNFAEVVIEKINDRFDSSFESMKILQVSLLTKVCEE